MELLQAEPVAELDRAIGEQLIETHLVPQTDLWVRVAPEAWADTAAALKAHGFDYFCFLSAIDWMPSPYGKGQEDPTAEPEEPESDAEPPAEAETASEGEAADEPAAEDAAAKTEVDVVDAGDEPAPKAQAAAAATPETENAGSA